MALDSLPTETLFEFFRRQARYRTGVNREPWTPLMCPLCHTPIRYRRDNICPHNKNTEKENK